jgi:copper chaperone CopZ
MFDFFKKTSPVGETVVFKIDGMHCVSCSLNIDGALEETEGVISATTNYSKSETKIEFDATKIDLDGLKKVIKDQGYGLV